MSGVEGSADRVNVDSLVLAGAGKMGGAMLEGWLSLGLDGRRVTVVEPHATPALEALCRTHGAGLNPDRALPPPELLVLAVKPQMLDEAAPRLAGHVGYRTLVLSIIAGKTIADLLRHFPNARAIVRAMPNTPAAVGRGIAGVVADRVLDARDRGTVDRLLAAVGRVEWLANEAEIDAVTAVSGSGPAYVFLLTECLSRAGERAGLPADLAARLARATVEGAGELMFRNATTAPDTLRRNVTSPGGTTAAALDVLMAANGLQPLMDAAVAAAQRRARELAG